MLETLSEKSEEKTEINIKEDIMELMLEISENGIGILVQNVLTNTLPIASGICQIVKQAKSLYERNLIKQTSKFIEGLNSKKISEEKKQKYIEKIRNNDSNTKDELERIALIINQNIIEEKSYILGKFMIAYINEEISKDKFFELTEALDKIITTDLKIVYELYRENTPNSDIDIRTYEQYKVERLLSTGICSFYHGGIKVRELNHGPRESVTKNEFGELFAKLVFE